MDKERKKIKKEIITTNMPKIRVESEKVNPVIEDPKPKKNTEDKYIRIVDDASSDERKPFVERIHRGEIKWAYYACDGNKGFHYYQVIK